MLEVLLSTNAGVCIAAIPILLAMLHRIFGTFNLWTIMNQYKQGRVFDREYSALFSRREALSYHISWARSRGDNEQDKRLTADLVALDKEIDQFESTIDVKRLSPLMRNVSKKSE